MNWIIKMYVRVREHRAQSMTEYALILAAIAVVVYASYKTLGNAITNEVTNVTNAL